MSFKSVQFQFKKLILSSERIKALVQKATL